MPSCFYSQTLKNIKIVFYFLVQVRQFFKISKREVVTMKSWLFLGIAILSEVIATSALKASDGFSKTTPSMIVLVGYGLAFYFLSLTLKTIPVGVAYAVWSGVGIIGVSIIGLLVFKQKLDFPALLGIAFILIGVLIMNVFSKSVAH
jgi:multidrug transporter EmrE-like cation transporter